MCRCPRLEHLHIDAFPYTFSEDSLFTFLAAHPGLLSLSLPRLHSLGISSYPHILRCCPLLTSLSIATPRFFFGDASSENDSVLHSVINTTDWARLAPDWRNLQIHGTGGGVVLHRYLLPILAAIGSQLRSLRLEDGIMSAWHDIGQHCPHLVDLDISESQNGRGCETQVGGCGGKKDMNERRRERESRLLNARAGDKTF